MGFSILKRHIIEVRHQCTTCGTEKFLIPPHQFEGSLLFRRDNIFLFLEAQLPEVHAKKLIDANAYLLQRDWIPANQCANCGNAHSPTLQEQYLDTRVNSFECVVCDVSRMNDVVAELNTITYRVATGSALH